MNMQLNHICRRRPARLACYAPVALIVCGILANIALGQSAVSTAFSYQGQLKSSGSPAGGSFNMDFKLFDVASGGVALATQSLPGVAVTNGLFSVQLDFGVGPYTANQA